MNWSEMLSKDRLLLPLLLQLMAWLLIVRGLWSAPRRRVWCRM